MYGLRVQCYHLWEHFTNGWWHSRSGSRCTFNGAARSQSLYTTVRLTARTGGLVFWRAMRSRCLRCASVRRSFCNAVTVARHAAASRIVVVDDVAVAVAAGAVGMWE